MKDERVDVGAAALERLEAAEEDFSVPEIERIAEAVIDKQRSQSAIGVCGDVAVRHMWDEYCWIMQNGPFDDNFGFGSLSGNWEDNVRGYVAIEVEKLPKHALVFLSDYLFRKDADNDQDDLIGLIWIEGIESAVTEEIERRAMWPNLDLIGPYRGDAIGYAIEGCGAVWSVLSDADEAFEILSTHVDAMIDPKADLAELASVMVDAFIAAARDEADGPILSGVLENYEGEIRKLLTEKDVLPALRDMRKNLLDKFDQQLGR